MYPFPTDIIRILFVTLKFYIIFVGNDFFKNKEVIKRKTPAGLKPTVVILKIFFIFD